MAQIDLGRLEREAYRASWSDGIVDIYLGVSLVWMGLMWTWVNDFSGIAGVLPALFVTPMLAVHKRFVEARLGHVEWRAARRGWERRNQWILLAAGVGLFLLGVAAYRAVDAGSELDLAPGVLAWLLALLTVGLALLLDARRLLVYGAVLAVGGGVVVLLPAEPGWPMLAGGVVATATGLAMLRRFRQRYPVIDPA